jgi:nucleoid DNA-binding protein
LSFAYLVFLLQTLAEGKSVSVTKFGIFTTVRTKERTGRNPRTGAAIHVDAKERVRFRPTKYLKEFVQPK